MLYDRTMRFLSWLAMKIPMHWLTRGMLWSSVSLIIIAYYIYRSYVY